MAKRRVDRPPLGFVQNTNQTLQESPEGEVSYLKFCGPLDHDFTEIPEIRDLPTAGLSATYHETKDAFLAEHPPGEEQIRGQADTRRRCDLVEDPQR